MLSVRLDEDLERRLNAACRRYGYNRSEAVKRSLTDWLAGPEPSPNAYELGADLFDRGSATEPPADPLRRRVWERLHERLFMDSGLFWSAPAKRRGQIEPRRRGIPAVFAGNLGIGFPTRRGDGAFPWPQCLGSERSSAKSKAAAGK